MGIISNGDNDDDDNGNTVYKNIVNGDCESNERNTNIRNIDNDDNSNYDINSY